MTTIVVLAGEGEYESHRMMAEYAEDVHHEIPDAKIHYLRPDVLPDYPDFPESSFGDLGVLREADLLVIYTRFRVVPDTEMAEIARYVDRRGNVLGLRTSTHAFHFPPESRWAPWNDGFGRDVLGSPWVSHHGHSSRTNVSSIPNTQHPILDGIPTQFSVRSWLYRVRTQPDCNPLLYGEPVDPEDAPTPGPVAWVRDRPKGRVFYTSLGHPDDFALEEFRRMLVNATRWCLDAPHKEVS